VSFARIPPRVFVLSPADCGGKRAGLLLRPQAEFPLARALRRGETSLGEVFSFLSGLYFRGKLTYAQAFGAADALIVTPAAGLALAQRRVSRDELLDWATVPVDRDNPRYRQPFERDAVALATSMPRAARVVLLGSLATPKYLDVLQPIFGDALEVPSEFVGRGDMSRGALLLRAVRAGCELTYMRAAAVARRATRSAA
jgi:hypothetical protein